MTDTQAEFEAAYIAHLKQQWPLNKCTPQDLAVMREGDGYGDGASHLAGAWWGWRVASVSGGEATTPGGWREVIDRIEDSIGAGAHAEQASYERGIVRPHLDALRDELSNAEEDAERAAGLRLRPIAYMYRDGGAWELAFADDDGELAIHHTQAKPLYPHAVGLLPCATTQSATPVVPANVVAWRIFDGEGNYSYTDEAPAWVSVEWAAKYGRKYEPLYAQPASSAPVQDLVASKPAVALGEELRSMLTRAYNAGWDASDACDNAYNNGNSERLETKIPQAHEPAVYQRWRATWFSNRDEVLRAIAASAAPAQPCGDAEQADAPQKLCSICHGYGRYQDGNSGTESDGYAPNIVECECAPEERFPRPAEQADEAVTDATERTKALWSALMCQAIETSSESYLSLRCVGMPPTDDEFALAVNRAIDAARTKDSE